jgi:intraflagellar transport protein 172
LDANLEFLYKSGKYEECLLTAQKFGDKQKINFYLWSYARVLQASGKLREACRTLFKWKENIKTLTPEEERICLSVGNELLEISGRSESEDFSEALKNFHDAIFPVGKMSQIVEACRLVLNLEIAKRQRMSVGLIARIAQSLCRYPAYPLERALLDAGKNLHAACNDSAAFYFLNRFLDVVEFMSDRDTSCLGDFAAAELPDPAQCNFPREFTGDAEEAKDLVLTWSVDPSLSEQVPTVNCEKCGAAKYSHSIVCGGCNEISEVCCVTGAPVRKAAREKCKNCEKPANRPDWQEWAAKLKACPACGSQLI